MERHSSRRLFVSRSVQAAAGLSLLPLAACSRENRAAASSGVPPDLILKLEAEIPELLVAERVPGVSIAIIDNGSVAWSRGFGVEHSVTKAPVDVGSLFEAGSVSKTVFAYAVLKLCEKGVLDLDTPLASYIVERWVDDPRFERITARHVLSHTTGLPNWRSANEPMQMSFEPGARWQYSGEGFSYLQLVVAHLTGHVSTESCERMFDGLTVCATEIDTYLKANLLRPFGMATSGYVWQMPSPQYAAGHDADGQPLNKGGGTPVSAARYGAAGNLATTATEYARFFIEVLDPKPADAFRLSAAMRDEMLRPQSKVDDENFWGLGWIIAPRENDSLIGHGGDNPGFKAQVLGSTARKSGFVIFTNGDRGDALLGKLVNSDAPLFRFVAGVDPAR